MKIPKRFLAKMQLLMVVASLALAAIAIGGAGSAVASPGSCVWEGYWACNWGQPNLSPGVADWFEAGTNLRNWTSGAVNGGNMGGYEVTQKCVTVVKGSNGEQANVACGYGYQGAAIGGAWQPGYLFIRHGAPGPRYIIGLSTQP